MFKQSFRVHTTNWDHNLKILKKFRQGLVHSALSPPFQRNWLQIVRFKLFLTLVLISFKYLNWSCEFTFCKSIRRKFEIDFFAIVYTYWLIEKSPALTNWFEIPTFVKIVQQNFDHSSNWFSYTCINQPMLERLQFSEITYKILVCVLDSALNFTRRPK